MTNNLSAGTRVKAVDFPRAQQAYFTATISNQTNTSYEVGSPEVAVRFQAPSSGRVAVCVGAGVSNNGANADRILVTYQVFSGDPADAVIFLSPEEKRGVSNAATGGEAAQFAGHTTMVDGLTPGDFYYAQMVHRTTSGAGTADISHRHITVWPIP